MAPELLVHPFSVNLKIDMWALGILLFLMLSGQPPFSGQYQDLIPGYPDIPTQIITGRMYIDESRWARISPEGRDLVQRLLDVNPDTRLSAWNCVSHPWVRFKRGGPAGNLTLLDFQEMEDGITFEAPSDKIPTLGALTPSQLAKEEEERTHLRVKYPPAHSSSHSAVELPLPAVLPSTNVSIVQGTPKMLLKYQQLHLDKRHLNDSHIHPEPKSVLSPIPTPPLTPFSPLSPPVKSFPSNLENHELHSPYSMHTPSPPPQIRHPPPDN